MPILRKKSLDKRINTQSNSTLSQSTVVKPFNQQIDRIKKLSLQLSQLKDENYDNYISEALNQVIQSKKSVLIGQRLPGYKQCFILMTKYWQNLKKKGSKVQENNNLPWNIFQSIIDEVNKLTQQQKYDELVKQANFPEAIFGFLQVTANYIEIESLKKQQKPKMMRKNSLKKVQQLPTLKRPFSRGKLSSLSKKQALVDKLQLLNATGSKKQIVSEQPSSIEDIVLKVISIVKNLSANKRVKKYLLTEQYMRLLNRYLIIFDEKTINSYGTSLITQVTSAYRYLASDQKTYKLFLASNCIQIWTKLIEMFPTSNDIVFNILRILSKISSAPQICQKMNEKKLFLKKLSSFFKVYRSNCHIIIRVAFIFANMTSFLEDIRNQLYFELNAWPDIYGCFLHYANSQLKGKSEVQKMGISMAAWDYSSMKKQSDIDAIVKIIRLIANLFTIPEIGQDIYIKDAKSFKELILKLKGLLQRKSISSNGDLISCILSCLSNVFFYDKQVLLSNMQYKQVKIQLLSILVNFVVQIDNEQICCQSLRVLSNITRMKEYIKNIIDLKIHEALLILLDSTSKQIVYYSLGTILNMLCDDNFKHQYKNIIVTSVIQILKACDNQDFDLVSLSLKIMGILMTENIQSVKIGELQQCLLNLGSHFDQIMMNSQKEEISSAQQLRSIINSLLNAVPEEKYICPIKNCGRKFQDQNKLKQHINRRHKAS